MQTTLRTVGALLLVAFAGQVRAADDKPQPKPAPPAAMLDATYRQVYQQVENSYIGALPADWADWQKRFDGRLTSTGALNAVLDVMLSHPNDRQLRILQPKEVELSKCRPVSGYVGLGIVFGFDVRLVEGFEIAEVLKGSPAANAGISTSDSTIVAIDGTRLTGIEYYKALELLLDSATTKNLTLKSNGGEKEVTVQRKEGQKLGIAFNRGKTSMKVKVLKVLKGSPGEAAGLKEGEEITHLYDHPVENDDGSWFTRSVEGTLGELVKFTLVRDGQAVTVELKRSIVERHELAFAFATADGKSRDTLRLTNLDWQELVATVDNYVAEINRRQNLDIDLRGATGDDPVIAARLAARFISEGDVLTFSERQGGRNVDVRYFVKQHDGKRTLFVQLGDTENQVEQLEATVGPGTELNVLVDARTSGTAEALASTLQGSKRATVSGTTTAGRNKLVTTTVFSIEDSEYFTEVPTRTLAPARARASIAVVPDKFETAPANASGILLALAVTVLGGITLLIVSIGASSKAKQASARTKRRIYIGALVVVAALLVGGIVVRSSGALGPKTDAQKAAAYINNILNTDEEVRRDFLKYAGSERGKRDVKADFGNKSEGISDADLKTACRLVTATTEGDIDAWRAITASYVYMPYARRQIGSATSYGLHLAGVNFSLESIFQRFGVERNGLSDGQFAVLFSPLNEEPQVELMVRDPKYPRQFSSDVSDLVTPKEALNALRLGLIRDALAAKAEKEAGR